LVLDMSSNLGVASSSSPFLNIASPSGYALFGEFGFDTN
jgi:hypothetical protein